MDCVVVGDSIAVGISGFTPCALAAKGGRTSRDQEARVTQLSFDKVIISLGSNDLGDPRLADHLRKLRAKITARQVIWILPYAWSVASVVKQVAFEWHDGWIALNGNFATRDGVHPNNSALLASWAMKSWP